jgi:RHS repeat-associated protein
MTGASTASYRYDGDGLRNTKTVGSVTTTFSWGSGQLPDLLADSSWNYVYGPGGMPLEQINTSSTLWYFHDQLGSTRALIDSAGHIAGTYAYTEYGVATHVGTAQTPLQYTGQYSDAETGFVYLRARFYDPATAQFLTVDPAYDSTGARYTYVNDDPLNNVDPSGEWGFLAVLFAVPGLGEVLAAAVAIVIVAVVVVAIIQHVSNYYASSSSNPRSGAHMPAQPPATLHGFPKAQPVQRKNGRARWEDKKKIYEWDSEKGEVECYRKSDELHLGGFDPETGEQTTKPDKGRQPGR